MRCRCRWPCTSDGRRHSLGWPRVSAAPVASPRTVDPYGLAVGELAATDRPLCRGPWPQPATPLQVARP
ncbi:hypothetical protein BHE74_00050718 [Ensete ventricosum]|nr:hypothetical protein BHE74_00050718 [Ensete ventricosum]RZR87468.1 hypothetical protein BHM03_00014908 [Ensete ventricosum]